MKTSCAFIALASGAAAFAPSTTVSTRQSALNLAVGEYLFCRYSIGCYHKDTIAIFVFISCVHILCSYSYAHIIFTYLMFVSSYYKPTGETAPDFSLVDQNGKTFTRSKNKKPLVVYFYPADSTPGCTTQAKAFQSEIQDIRKQYKADVVGISGQGAESKQKFASEVS